MHPRYFLRWVMVWAAVVGPRFPPAAAGEAAAELFVPSIFGDHMLLQRDKPVPVWGRDRPGREVAVVFGKVRAATVAGADGRWRVDLPPLSADAEGRELVIRGSTEKRFADVLVGEVWLAAGQSNMEWSLSKNTDGAALVEAAANPALRLYRIPARMADFPVERTGLRWARCDPAADPRSVGSFSAVAYFFAAHLQKELGVPVGMICAAWGSTRIEPWTPPEGFAQVPELADIAARAKAGDEIARGAPLGRYIGRMERWAAEARAARADPSLPFPSQPVVEDAFRLPSQTMPAKVQPRVLYNGMIAPIVPFALRGAVWYQGESNIDDGHAYLPKMRALLQGWRTVWNAPELPFLFVQLAPYAYSFPDGVRLKYLMEAQTRFRDATPGAGMAVIADLVPDTWEIHPPDKRGVGLRLALLALRDAYGRRNLVAEGPILREARTEGDSLRLVFREVGGGLATRDGRPPAEFELFGFGAGWRAAEAAIDGDSVVLRAAGIDRPLLARHAWRNAGVGNLMNREGLPAGSFRAGSLPEHPEPAGLNKNKPYRLVYDLDLNTLDGTDPKYSVDNSREAGPFSRVAYVLELTGIDGEYSWIRVEADAFTSNAGHLGVPTFASRGRHQGKLTGVAVASNVAGVKRELGGLTGWLEFWPSNSRPKNESGVAGADDRRFDWGDQMDRSQPEGYGSMQMHLPEFGQVLFALNHWKEGGADFADVGIGNNPAPGGQPDYTGAMNGGDYIAKRLRVYVQ